MSGRICSIVIVEDHPLMRKGVRQIIEETDGMQVVGEADSAGSAVALIARVEPDIAIVDISLEAESSGVDLIKSLSTRGILIKTIVLSMHTETYYVERALRAGAAGYLSKSEAPRSIIDAIKTVMSGRTYVSNSISGDMIKKLLEGDAAPNGLAVGHLSNRELVVLELIGGGFKSRDIAKKLNISVNTVEAHRKKIKTKLGYASSNELTRNAIAWLHSKRR